MNFELITVGIADMRVAKTPDILRTILGSCVGICLYDRINHIGGLAHIMLPSAEGRDENPAKYADTAVPALIKKMLDKGADRENFTAKLIGGATMFNISKDSMIGNIGRNNIIKVREILSGYNIHVISEEIGGDSGRTIDFFTENGSVKIKTPLKKVIII